MSMESLKTRLVLREPFDRWVFYTIKIPTIYGNPGVSDAIPRCWDSKFY